MSGDPIDLDAIEARATRAGQSWVHDPYGYLTTLVGYDVPALVAEVRSLRDESAALVDEIERCDRAEMALRAVAAETEVRRLRDQDAETRRLIEAWVRHIAEPPRRSERPGA